LATFCLLSSSVTVEIAVRALARRALASCRLWTGITIVLGAEFLHRTAIEWTRLIRVDKLTMKTNLFGTTYYALVGLHASHVVVGLCLLSIVLIAALRGAVLLDHHHRVELVSWYWHFVDAVWIVVFLTVYVFGR
jgi:cytochrome c oxidase subunit 3/cytochrome o ubiquinol oxidase subunit 3